MTVHDFLGEGPTGEVYTAETQGQQVVIKLLSPAVATDRSHCRNLFRLLNHLGSVQHPGIGRIFSGSESGYQDRPFFVREYIGGNSLSHVVTHNGPLAPTQALTLCMRIAETLTEAHRAGALHLHIKPSNVFVLPNDQIKLVDFGLGQPLQLRGGKVIYGDPRYLAPEQLEANLVSFRSDIYGLGSLLYYLLSGRPPFEGNLADLLAQINTRVPPPPSSLLPTKTGLEQVDQVVARALEKTPTRRYLSMQHFGRAMDGVVQSFYSRPGSANNAAPWPSDAEFQYDGAAPNLNNDTVRVRATPGKSGPFAAADEGNAFPHWEGHRETPTPEAPPPAPAMAANVAPDAPPPSAQPRNNGFGADATALRDTAPITVPPMQRNVGATAPAAPPKPRAKAGSSRKKKRRHKPTPIVAVRGEAAVRIGPGGQIPAPQREQGGESVMVQSDFLDEARGPERHQETMEIRIRPLPGSAHEGRKSPRKAVQYVVAVVALVVLFLVAAIGAATLARWLSAPASEGPLLEIPAPRPPSSTVPPQE
jgi:serine/threonine-protein kinase